MKIVGEIKFSPYWEDRQRRITKPLTCCTKASPGMNKLNTDTAIYQDGTAGLVFVVRNANGEVIMVGAKRINARGSSTLIEAMALKFSLETIIERGITRLIAEMDFENLARALRREKESEAYVMSMIKDIWILAANVNCLEYRNVKRTTNRAANALAHFGKEQSFEWIWIKKVPRCFFDVI
ncbi:hypothetical protein ACS0TY_033888 [Phlomoides rotata]